jgi:alanyl-tRNA synthetase
MDLGRNLSTDILHIEDRINSEESKMGELIAENRDMKKSLIRYEIKNIIENKISNIILKGYDDKKFEDIKLIASTILEEEPEKYILILYSDRDKRILLVNNLKKEVDCGKLFKDNIENFNGKGGGNVSQAQGIFSNSDDMVNFSNFLYSSVA